MTRLLFSSSLAALALASSGSTACTTHTIVRPEPTVTFEKTCANTACDAVQEAEYKWVAHAHFTATPGVATGAGLKPEFLAAAQFCARQTSCDDAAACLDAWRKAI